MDQNDGAHAQQGGQRRSYDVSADEIAVAPYSPSPWSVRGYFVNGAELFVAARHRSEATGVRPAAQLARHTERAVGSPQ
ncbi:hypothetical protein SSBR45G_26990 [Bradyrhizobium sp. SSBR45G]|nr:hypothetical protein SSBR45G_26990 [Bradyrhizobium sp. SSBR45G]GLH85028.1 hypothetical protein SSBR45R_24880 [Bradyrhizobium sp. SSBR45R]